MARKYIKFSKRHERIQSIIDFESKMSIGIKIGKTPIREVTRINEYRRKLNIVDGID